MLPTKKGLERNMTFQTFMIALPETNIAPENGWLED